jgi:uncharacterized membrane protein YhhN
MKKQFLLPLLCIVLLLEIIGEVLNVTHSFPYLIYVFKPLLMPLLIFWYLQSSPSPNKVLIIALIFSFFGDVFLMFLPLNELFFLAGLGSFLITHLLYTYIFIKQVQAEKKSILWKRPHFVLLFIVYGLSLIAFLNQQNSPAFIAMQVPVIIYASVIMVMVMSAIGRYERVAQASFSWVLIGALLFMLSDSIIALNNFSSLFDTMKYVPNVAIMALYVGGQYLITAGILKAENEQ